MSDTSFGESVKRAVIWRSGSQILAQIIAWTSTLMVIRILDPSDYGIFAMTQVILAFLAFMNGYGFASSLIQDREIDEQKIRQVFGLLILVNSGIAIIQLILAPIAAAYYRQPIVAELLDVQALIYLATPFIALPQVLLTRDMDFKRPAIVNIISAVISAAVALGCALAGYGVWTLVYAPLALFWTRGIGLMIAARLFIWPSFQFKGAGRIFNFGLFLIGSHLFWTILTQADIFIAARTLSPTDLGFFAEALFLTTIISSKFVPPLNDVAFPAYAQIQDDMPTLRAAFLKAVRLIMLVTCPLYFGLAVVADPLVYILLGEKWLPMAPLVSILALAMPALTLHTLFSPALTAIGKPKIPMYASFFGAIVMPVAFLIGVQWGSVGLAWSWVIGFPPVVLVGFLLARPHLGIALGELVAAVTPGLSASFVMACAVYLVDRSLGDLNAWISLPTLVITGGIAYAAILFTVSRDTFFELINLVIRRRLAEPQPATG